MSLVSLNIVRVNIGSLFKYREKPCEIVWLDAFNLNFMTGRNSPSEKLISVEHLVVNSVVLSEFLVLRLQCSFRHHNECSYFAGKSFSETY